MENKMTVETRYTLDVHREYRRLASMTHGVSSFMIALMAAAIGYMTLSLLLYPTSFSCWFVLIASGFYLFMIGNKFRTPKDGGMAYKQILFNHNGQHPHQHITFEADGIRVQNLTVELEKFFPYDSVRQILESKNLILVITDLKMAVTLDKNAISGGDAQQLMALLEEKCTHRKGSIKTPRLGTIVHLAAGAVMALCMVIAGWKLLTIPQAPDPTASDNQSFTQIADKLEALDIHISQETLDEVTRYGVTEYKVLNLLTWEGSGTYDQQTWEWTPSQSGVFWMDMEVMNVSTMYSDFLRGVDAMSEELEFTDIFENYDDVDWEKGSGEVYFGYTYQGMDYMCKASMNYDWFDISALDQVSGLLSLSGSGKSLWYTEDGGQGILLYYGTLQQAQELSRLAGVEFDRAN